MHPVRSAIEAASAKLPDACGNFVVGFSGGLDSTVLLHALSASMDARRRGLRAVHVDHGLQPASSGWAEHCLILADELGVACDVVRVSVDVGHGTGPEDAARRARYAAFAQLMKTQEVCVIAHHRDDQAETVLLKLLRGAGPEGLGAMRELRAFAQGHLWRPLLNISRASLRDYATLNALRWLDDPSNANVSLRRNFIRTSVRPLLQSRWPEADAALAQSAAWARSAAEFIDAHARAALAAVLDAQGERLNCAAWLDLDAALRDPVLRLWLRRRGLDEPSHLHVEQLVRQLREAARERAPCIRWKNTELRRYRDWLHALRPLLPIDGEWQAPWSGTSIVLPSGGSLRWSAPVKSSPTLTVRYRRGGERIKPAGSAHTRQLRLLLQEAGVPTWQRERLPLIFFEERLIAVADMMQSAEAAQIFEATGAQIEWLRD